MTSKTSLPAWKVARLEKDAALAKATLHAIATKASDLKIGKKAKQAPPVAGNPKVKIRPLALEKMTLILIADGQARMNRFSEKAAAQILAKHMGKQYPEKEIKDPYLNMMRALHIIYDDRTGDHLIGAPAIAFKRAAIRGAKMVGACMKDMQAAFHVRAKLVELVGAPEMDVDAVRNSGVADIRIRPRFDEWGVCLPIIYNEGQVSPEQIVQFFLAGGFGCGFGEYRLEKGGDDGGFHVGSRQELDALRKRTAPARRAWFKDHPDLVKKVRDEKTQLIALVNAVIALPDAPDPDDPDLAKKIGKPKKAHVYKNRDDEEDEA
jgi:hypothetical protein